MLDSDPAASNWYAPQGPHANPAASLAARTDAVSRQLSEALDARPSGRIRLLSIHAGRGDDVIETLSTHDRKADVHAVLLEADPRQRGQAWAATVAAGLANVDVGAAGLLFSGLPATEPADVLMVGGLFGNLAERQLPCTIAALPEICRPGAQVIWTRHRRKAQTEDRIRAAFAANGFEESCFETTPGFSVGSHRLADFGGGGLEGELSRYLVDRRSRLTAQAASRQQSRAA